MIVDVHNHIFFPILTSSPTDKSWVLDPDFLVKSGVINKVWLLSLGNVNKGYNGNQDEDILHLAKKHEGFFVPFAYLDFTKKPEIIDEFHKQGFAGLKAIFPPFAYDDERAFPFYEKAQKYKMPILFHLGGAGYIPPEHMAIGPERMASKNMQVITMDLIAKMFPKLAIICAHMGGAHSYEFALFVAKRHPNVHLDISCSIVDRFLDKMKEVIDMVGPDKILFGSDVRENGPIKKALFWRSYFDAQIGKPEIRDKIMGLNAEYIVSASGFDWKKIKCESEKMGAPKRD